jgi:hypothetical protein
MATETEPTNEEIASRAYEIYERNGRVEGRALDDWLDAKAALLSANESSDSGHPQREPAADPARPQPSAAGAKRRRRG